MVCTHTYTANATATNTINAGDFCYYGNRTDVTGASGTVLDFAWNNPNTTFENVELRVSSDTDNSNASRRFRYSGTRQQLQYEMNTWTTATTGTLRFQTGSLINWSGVGKVRNALMKIFEEPSKELKKEMTKQEKKLFTAKRKSEKLLKDMLSPKEYNSLKLHGELEIPSKMDDEVIFIVKKDPNEMVHVKKKSIYSHKLCAVSEDLEMPVGDQLLSKVLLLKTDEKKFREIAIKHG